MEKENDLQVRDARRGFFWITTDVARELAPKIGAMPFAVYSMLCSYANNETAKCFPSQQLLAEKLAISRNTVKRCLVVLENHGMISKQRDGAELNAKTIYTLLPTNGGQNLSRGQNLTGEGSKFEHGRGQNLSTNNTNLTRLNNNTYAEVLQLLPSPDDIRSDFQKCKEYLFKCYSYLNNGEVCPWDESDAAQLSRLLRSKPKISVERFHEWLLYYADSQNINPADRPRKIIHKITDYSGGPLNEYGRPLEYKKARL